MPIYDAGEEDDHCYVVTEYVHGARTLAAFCRADDLLRIDVVVEIIFKCAKALHYAHSRGVIHRDIKPSNILFTQDGDVRIIDFGIALVADSDISRIEGIAGSPSYMSPEQVQSHDLTNRSDLYSLGAVMYELLTGSRPFRAGNLTKLLHQIVYATPAPIHTLRPDAPEELEQVVAIALQKDPEKRYRSGLDFAAALTRVHQKLRAQAVHDRPGRAVRCSRAGSGSSTTSRRPRSARCCNASTWQDYAPGEEIVKEGDMDDRFYIVVSGNCLVERHGQQVGRLEPGDCFGETSYVPGRAPHGDGPCRGQRDRAEGQRDAARTGLGDLPAALQPRLPAVADRPAAGAGERDSRRLIGDDQRPLPREEADRSMSLACRHAVLLLALCCGTSAGVAAPQRVMSLNLCADQLLMALLPESRLVSITWLSRTEGDPELLALAARLPVNHGSAEEVLQVRPDLVVAGRFTTGTTRALLKRTGVRLLEIEPVADWDGIRRVTREVAAAVGERERGERLLAAMDADLAALAARQAAEPVRVIGWGGAGDDVPRARHPVQHDPGDSRRT